MPSPIRIKMDFGSILPKKNIKKSKKIAFCALFSALGIVLMYLGAMVEVLDISMACITSMICVIALAEIGGAYPWLVFAVTGVLSFIILPQKFGALIYICLAGYYPMLKAVIERTRTRIAEWILKILFFNAAMTVMILLAVFVLAIPDMQKWYVISLFALGNITFAAYDIALSMLIKLYFLKYRKLLRIDRILK